MATKVQQFLRKHPVFTYHDFANEILKANIHTNPGVLWKAMNAKQFKNIE